MDRRPQDPAEFLPDGGGDCAVGADGHFVAQRDVGDQEASVGEDQFGLLWAFGIQTEEPHEPEVSVSAAKERFKDDPHSPVEGAMDVPEPLVPRAEEVLEVVFYDFLELVLGRAGAVAGRRGGGGRCGQGDGGRWARESMGRCLS